MISKLIQTTVENNRLIFKSVDPNYEISMLEKFACNSFKGFTTMHPCIGAKALGGTHGFNAAVYPSMSSYSTAVQLLYDLNLYYKISDLFDRNIKTLAIFFVEQISTQDEFAAAYWNFVRILHDVDSVLYPYDDAASPDPNSDNFELSLAGRAVFTTTLNRGSPRTARTFIYSTWVMNQLRQFEKLREEGKFENWQNTIRKHDSKLDPSGSSNPILVDHGYGSAANQLAGSALEDIGSYFVPNITFDQKTAAKVRVMDSLEKEGADSAIVRWVENNSIL